MADQETEQVTTEPAEQVASTEPEGGMEAVQEEATVAETPADGVEVDGDGAPAEDNADKSEPVENTEAASPTVVTEASPNPETAAEETPTTEEAVKTEEQVGEENVTGEDEGDRPQSTASESKADADPVADAGFSSAEGEAQAEETPVIIQPMSREETPPLPVEGDLPVPGTPEKPGSLAEEEEELLLMEEEIVPQYNREELMQKYQAATQERETLNQQNRALQHKLSEYFRKKKNEEARQEVDKNATDQEQRYMKYMSNLEELRHQQAAELDNYHEQLEEIKEKKAEKQGRVEEEWSKATDFKRAVALAAINSRSGRPIPLKDLEIYEGNERKKEAEVSHVRLENIKLKNRLKKQEMQLKQKEELAEGLHLIDFEQLKIENQTYNEKIEERNEELLKLRKKITSTVQVLTHLKEKLQFVQAENYVRKDQLADVEHEVAQKRDILSRTKQARDALRHENNKFHQRCGLLGNTDLLRDFEVSTDEVDDLDHRLDMLKRTHAELTLSLNGVKRKIELAKENQS